MKPVGWFPLLMLPLLLTGGLLRADDPDVLNVYKSDEILRYYGRLETAGYIVGNGGRPNRDDLVRVEASGMLNPRLKYVLSGDANAISESSTLLDSEIRPWECYLRYGGNGLSVRLGQQVIRWGKGDEINPTDTFTPEDTREFLTRDRGDRKNPIPMVQTKYDFDPCLIELIWIPVFQPNELPDDRSRWEPALFRMYHSGVSGLTYEKGKVPEGLDGQTVAVKFERNTPDFDASLSYSYHYNEGPTLIPNPATMQVVETYSRKSTIGGDFETSRGDWAFHCEAGYTLDDDVYTQDTLRPVVQMDTLQTVAGVDYSRHAWSVYCQYFFLYLPEWKSDMVLNRLNDGVTWRINKTFCHDNLQCEVRGMLNFPNFDSFCRFSVAYDLTDRTKLSVGYDSYAGKANTLYGQFADNSQMFIRLKYSF